MNKVCIKCNEDRPLRGYYKHKEMRDGHLNKCKVCIKEAVKTNAEVVGNSYDFSEKGVVRVLYKTQKRHQKIRGHGDIPYTKPEFSEWLYANNFKKVYDTWVESSHDFKLKPSVDRLDDYKGYSFSNIRLVTWQDNREHQQNNRTQGIGKDGALCHSIEKLNEDGDVIKTYISYQDVRRQEGFCVHRLLSKGEDYKEGFYWRKVLLASD